MVSSNLHRPLGIVRQTQNKVMLLRSGLIKVETAYRRFYLGKAKFFWFDWGYSTIALSQIPPFRIEKSSM